MNMAISKANKKLGWVLRTFRTRSIEFLRKLWNSLVQTHLDYCSVLWAGSANKTQRRALEGPLRSLTKAAWGLRNMSYWRRLKEFKLYSNEQRMERYAAMYIWKTINGKAPSLGLLWNENYGSRSGHNLALPKLKGPEGKARGYMRNSIKYGGVKIFNSLPEDLKIFKGSKESFKKKLDQYLSVIPDQPYVGQEQPGGRTINRKPSNSIIDWARTIDTQKLLDDLKMDIVV